MKISDKQQVIDYMNKLEHPLKNEIEEVRKIILSSNREITEHIKWNAPSYRYNHEDRVTFNFQGKEFFRLVFHCGAKAKDTLGKEPILEDTTGLLDWVAADRAIVKLTDMNDVIAKQAKLTELVAKWIMI